MITFRSLPGAVGRLAFACTATVTPLLVASCAGQPAEGPRPVTAAEALARARTAMAAAQSFSFELTHPAGATSLPGGLFLTRAQGTTVAPDRLSLKAEANFGRVFVKVDAIVIGGDTYMTNFLTGAWAKVPAEDSPFAFLDVPGLVSSLVGEVLSPSVAATSQTGADADIVVIGQLPAKPLAALVGTVDESRTVSVRLTLDEKSFHLKEVLIEGALQLGEGENASRLIKFSGYGVPISIVPPI